MDNIITISKEQSEQIQKGRFFAKGEEKPTVITRQEERKQAAQQRYDGESQYQVAKAQAFLTGARWADKTMIDKACEWLRHQEEMIGISFEEDFIERFRKAMEE